MPAQTQRDLPATHPIVAASMHCSEAGSDDPAARVPRRPARPHLIVAAVFVAVWALAAASPKHPAAFWLENLVAFAFAIVLVATYPRFRFSTRSYVHMLVFMAMHEIGAHYTYSETPVGDWLAAILDLERNHYDRIVHFAFGAVMARPLGELLQRGLDVPAEASRWLVWAGLLALSAAYELLESWTARIVSPELGTAFLGAQGDPWDAQKDMTAAMLGVAVSHVGAALIAMRARARARSLHAKPRMRARSHPVMGRSPTTRAPREARARSVRHMACSRNVP